MGFFRDLSNLYKLYKDDLEKKASRDKLLSQGITEDWLKELIRQADTGVVAELVFPSGVTLKITRTLKGADVSAAGVDYREDYLIEKDNPWSGAIGAAGNVPIDRTAKLR